MSTARLVGAWLLALGVFPLNATAPVPRASPELSLLDNKGRELPLSSFKGKVVLVEFLLTDCPHCARVAQTIAKIGRDLGSEDFQAVGIAIENGARAPLVTDYAQDLKIGFPVGYSASDQVDRYLGRAGTERVQVPQLVLIDREGVIRAQSRPVGENLLESPAYLRKSIEALLNEGGSRNRTALTSLLSVAVLILITGFLIRRNRFRPTPR